MPISIRRIDQAPKGRLLVASDIHGNKKLLERALEEAKFSSDDMLVIDGDIIEKGPDSLGTLRYVMKLAREPNVAVTAGNVDLARAYMLETLDESNARQFFDYLVYMRRWKGTSLFDEMTREFGVTSGYAGEALSSKMRVLGQFMPELEFLRGLPHAVETPDFLFVHARCPTAELSTLGSLEPDDVLSGDAFLDSAPSFSKWVVVGHWPSSLYNASVMRLNPLIDPIRRIISIDGGCGIKSFGQLNLLSLTELPLDKARAAAEKSGAKPGQLAYVSQRLGALTCTDDLPVRMAAERQEASKDSVNVRWGDQEAVALEKNADFTFMQHVSSGKKLWVPNSALDRNGKITGDCTDYELPVEPGDRLGIIESTSRGFLAKKDGVVGWYRGALADQ